MNAFAWNLVLAVLWMSISGSFGGHQLVIGLILGYAMLGISMRQVPEFAAYTRRVPKIFAFMGFFLRELIASNLKVAYDVVTPTHYMKPGVIAVTLEAKTDAEITLISNLISLTPGTLTLDVSTDRRVLYMHVMYLEDPDQVTREFKRFEARVLELMR